MVFAKHKMKKADKQYNGIWATASLNLKVDNSFSYNQGNIFIVSSLAVLLKGKTGIMVHENDLL